MLHSLALSPTFHTQICLLTILNVLLLFLEVLVLAITSRALVTLHSLRLPPLSFCIVVDIEPLAIVQHSLNN